MRKKDLILWGSLTILIIFGIVMMIGLSANDNPAFYYFQRQIISIFISLIVFFIFAKLNWRFFRNSKFLILFLYFISILSLVLLLIVADPERGVRGWFNLGFFSIQPIEFVKVIVILLLAKYFSSRNLEAWQIKHLAISGGFVALPVALTILQPDLASAVIVGAIWLGIVLISGIRLQQVFILFLVFIILGTFSWFFVLQPYQQSRILTFLNPELDPLGGGYNQRQALIALGSGGLFGKGLGQGTQTTLGFLPSSKTDFVFAAIGEELGFVGIVIFLITFAVFFYRLIHYINILPNNFCRLFVAGFAIKILSEFIVNISMNVGILPVAGIPLPFISFGGSHFLANFIALGIILNMIKNNSIIGDKVEDKYF